MRERAGATPAQRLDQQPGLDADRARSGAQPAGGARVDAVVVVQRAHRGRSRRPRPRARAVRSRASRRCAGAATASARATDTWARRSRTRCTGRRSDRTAAAASGSSDARRGSSLMTTPGLSRPCGSNSRLIARISAYASRAPFELDERRDVAAGAVLGLERAVVLFDDHPAQRVHEAAVALDLRGVVEVLREHEVQVALERMAEDDRVGVAVLREQRAAGRASPRRAAVPERRRPR